MSDIFREVEEEIRHDEYKRLWSKYGIYVIGVGLAIVFGVGGYKGWQAYQKSRAEQAGEKFATALVHVGAGETAKSAEILDELGRSGPEGYALLSRFKQAAILAKDGRRDQAVAAYDEIARAARSDASLSTLAQIRSALLLVDTAERSEIVRRMAPLDRSTTPWRNLAREILALAAYRAGDYAAANGFFLSIVADPASPPNLRRRAQVMISLLRPELAARGLDSGPAKSAAGN